MSSATNRTAALCSCDVPTRASHTRDVPCRTVRAPEISCRNRLIPAGNDARTDSIAIDMLPAFILRGDSPTRPYNSSIELWCLQDTSKVWLLTRVHITSEASSWFSEKYIIRLNSTVLDYAFFPLVFHYNASLLLQPLLLLLVLLVPTIFFVTLLLGVALARTACRPRTRIHIHTCQCRCRCRHFRFPVPGTTV